MPEWPDLTRGALRLGPDADVAEQLVLEDTHLGLAVPLDPEGLRWLLTSAIPAALAALPRRPLVPRRSPEREAAAPGGQETLASEKPNAKKGPDA